MNMKDKKQIMREYGATVFEDVTQVDELFEGRIRSETAIN